MKMVKTGWNIDLAIQEQDIKSEQANADLDIFDFDIFSLALA